MIALLAVTVGVCVGFVAGSFYEFLRRGGTVDQMIVRAVSPDDVTAEAAELNRALDVLLQDTLPRRQDVA